MTTATALPSLAAFRSSELKSSMKINARVGESAATQLAELTRKTGLGVSEIVRLSLAHYHEAVFQTQKPKPKSRIVEMAGKYASKGPDAGNISTDYKRIFGEGIAKKYGLAPLDSPTPSAESSSISTIVKRRKTK